MSHDVTKLRGPKKAKKLTTCLEAPKVTKLQNPWKSTIPTVTYKLYGNLQGSWNDKSKKPTASYEV